jgi:hypothetical protein
MELSEGHSVSEKSAAIQQLKIAFYSEIDCRFPATLAMSRAVPSMSFNDAAFNMVWFKESFSESVESSLNVSCYYAAYL